MTTPYSASSLVDLANEQTLLIYSRVIDDEDGPPRWVLCTADGNDTRPASRVTVVRAEGEDCKTLWARVLTTIRQLKRSRGFQHHVTVLCMQSDPPVDAAQGDNRWNAARALWHDADHDHDPMRRVQALGMLADLHNFRGSVPHFN